MLKVLTLIMMLKMWDFYILYIYISLYLIYHPGDLAFDISPTMDSVLGLIVGLANILKENEV